MDTISAPKPKRSILYNKLNREVNLPCKTNLNIMHIDSPFELDISPIVSLNNSINNFLTSTNKSNSFHSLSYSNVYGIEDFICNYGNSKKLNNYEYEASKEIVGILLSNNMEISAVNKSNVKISDSNNFSKKIKIIKETPICHHHANNKYIHKPYFNKVCKCPKMPLLDKLRRNEKNSNIDYDMESPK